MPRGSQFGDVIAAFRAEARQSSQVNVGTDSLPHVKQVIIRTQRMLYAKNVWPFLRTVPQVIQLNAGQRFYDAPADLNIDRIERVALQMGTSLWKMERGIDFEDYAIWNSGQGVRSGPTFKYDFRWTGTTTQIEVFPIPDSSANQMMFKCMRPLRPLINLSDPLDLDDDLVVLFATSEELAAQKANDAPIKQKAAEAHLASLLKNTASGDKDIRMNLSGGNNSMSAPSKVVIAYVAG